VLRKAGDIGIEERQIPTPSRGEVPIEVGSVGVCRSDVHYYEHGRIGPYVVDAPLVLGHEAGGTIVEVGPGVAALRAGQRVSIEPGVPCRHCRQCLAGRYNLCPDVRFFAMDTFRIGGCDVRALPGWSAPGPTLGPDGAGRSIVVRRSLASARRLSPDERRPAPD
jgi:L-iditol 2-dehydrogenase